MPETALKTVHAASIARNVKQRRKSPFATSSQHGADISDRASGQMSPHSGLSSGAPRGNVTLRVQLATWGKCSVYVPHG